MGCRKRHSWNYCFWVFFPHLFSSLPWQLKIFKSEPHKKVAYINSRAQASKIHEVLLIFCHYKFHHSHARGQGNRRQISEEENPWNPEKWRIKGRIKAIKTFLHRGLSQTVSSSHHMLLALHNLFPEFVFFFARLPTRQLIGDLAAISKWKTAR